MSKAGQNRIGRRAFLADTTAAAIGLSQFNVNPLVEALALNSQEKNKVASLKYDMLIFGVNTIYLSLLPRFSSPGVDSPYRFQLILEASLSSRQQNIFMKDLEKLKDEDTHLGKRYYTLNTERFDVKKIFSQDIKPGDPPISFRGTIFRGLLGKGGRPVFENVVATVKRRILYRELDTKTLDDKSDPTLCPSAKTLHKASKVPKLEYWFFGNDKGYFMAHLLTKPPDFDQILYIGTPSSQMAPSNMSDALINNPQIRDLVSKGLRVIIQRTNSIRYRVKANQMVKGEFLFCKLIVIRPGVASDSLEEWFIADKEIYFEEGELRLPAEFGITEAEKEAGFP